MPRSRKPLLTNGGFNRCFLIPPVVLDRKGELFLEATDLAKMSRGGTFVPEKLYNRKPQLAAQQQPSERPRPRQGFSVPLPCVLSPPKAGGDPKSRIPGLQVARSAMRRECWYSQNPNWFGHWGPKHVFAQRVSRN